MKVIVCTNCATRIEPNNNYCTGCGKRISGRVVDVGEASAEKTCSKCGKKMRLQDKYCGYCGTAG